MSLLQTYRSQAAARQTRRLLGYLALAVTVHAVGAVGLAIWQSQEWLNSRSTSDAIPIEFVAIEPDPQPAQPPASTKRRAQTNSTAGGNPNPNLSVQAGNSQPKAQSQSNPQPSPQPKAQPKAQSNPQPKPQPVTPPIPPVPPISPTAALSGAPQPAPIRSAPPSVLASPSPQSPSRLSTPSPLPSASPFPSPTATSPTATSLGSPISRDIALEGGSEPFNSNRAAANSGVDATQDVIWGRYLDTLNRTIDQNWQRVAVEATRRTKIQFRVDRQGQLRDLQIVQSSGDTLADQAALEAIRAAAPFAPLPQNAAEEVLIVNFTFTQWLTPASP
ncbi:TonB family protein [Leptolyngbya sp. NK1-12]|uniref:TonB family protein n=1 Tax=Leptolyngbya sp. NK1-12 TaxID=2547451 RepID=A0AA96WGW5_9CYAN|nr:TonB family protein [Leptolyngbya sp. NK1-12]WNZ24864.1 TonB family protein [Leptolyngbya sp. NK1-12]